MLNVSCLPQEVWVKRIMSTTRVKRIMSTTRSVKRIMSTTRGLCETYHVYHKGLCETYHVYHKKFGLNVSCLPQVVWVKRIMLPQVVC